MSTISCLAVGYQHQGGSAAAPMSSKTCCQDLAKLAGLQSVAGGKSWTKGVRYFSHHIHEILSLKIWEKNLTGTFRLAMGEFFAARSPENQDSIPRDPQALSPVSKHTPFVRRQKGPCRNSAEKKLVKTWKKSTALLQTMRKQHVIIPPN
jgi:hypothetical protein